MSNDSTIFELIVLSGKGGTGKTSVTASLAALANNPVLADCDVDASNLELVLSPQLQSREDFSGGMQASIDSELCTTCGKCKRLCRFDAILFDGPQNAWSSRTYRVDPPSCEGCGVCATYCPSHAISLHPAKGGEWFISDTRFGPLVHARLQPGLGNSGILTTLVREQARQIAHKTGRKFMLVDGPPGVGCPVIASLTGATRILAVTEPTPSGVHDLERVIELAKHFQIPAWVCINKHDLNAEVTSQIEQRAAEQGATVVGRIPYDRSVTEAQRQGRPVVELDASPAGQAIVQLWKTLSPHLPEQLS